MNLLYPLSSEQRKTIEQYGEEIIYCIPADISPKGDLLADCFAVATEKHLFLINKNFIEKTFLTTECRKFKCEPMVHSGVLIVKTEDTDILFCRFTMAYMIAFSYLAEGLERLRVGQRTRVFSKEPEKICPVCKRGMSGAKTCVRCSSKGRFFRRIMAMAKPYKAEFIVITVLMVLSAALVLGTRYVERIFIDKYLIPLDGKVKDILTFFIAIFVMNMSVLLIAIVRNKMTVKLGTNVSKDLREQIYSKLQSTSLEFIMDRSPGELLNRIGHDTSVIRRFFEMGFSNMLSSLLSMVGALTIMCVMDWKITLAASTVIPFILIVSRTFRRRFKRKFSAQWRFEDRANNQLQDALSGIRVIKAFGKEEEQSNQFIDINRQLAEKQSSNEKFWATFNPAVGLLMGLASLIVLYMGGRNVLDGTFTIGELGQYLAYTAILMGPLTWMSMLPRLLYQTISSIERIYDVLEDEREIGVSQNPISDEIEGNVSFENVRFGYKTYEPVLENVSFEVTKGEMIGIVGYSGAGKSTLINLLIRLYDPNYGDIKIDGKSINRFDPQNLHSQIGVVLQDTFLFSGSILDNIRYSMPQASLDQIIHAAKVANAHDFIVKFPDGYNTRVGEKGITLSGGERQRIAIARAILNDPKILVLDEATSSLDTETEFQIQEAIHRLTQGRTTFVIAHRLSTLRKSDRIIVIDQNKIAEIGKHDELIAKRGIYYNLVKAQLEMNAV